LRTIENSRVYLSNTACKAPGLPRAPKESPKISLERKTNEQKYYIRTSQRPQPALPLICSNPSATNLEDSAQFFVEEEKTAEVSSGVKLRLKSICEEVSQMRRRVDRLNRLMNTFVPECPDETCLQYEAELAQLGEWDPYLLALVIDENKLDHQLNELSGANQSSELEIKMIRRSLFRDRDAAKQVEIRLKEIDSFMRILEKEQAICRERYWNIEREKMSWSDFEAFCIKWIKSAKYKVSKTQEKMHYGRFKNCAQRSIYYLNRACMELNNYFDTELRH
ncbi:hypothetical protein KR018_005629, partial [Drosophila ironensis]